MNSANGNTFFTIEIVVHCAKDLILSCKINPSVYCETSV